MCYFLATLAYLIFAFLTLVPYTVIHCLCMQWVYECSHGREIMADWVLWDFKGNLDVLFYFFSIILKMY